MTFTYLVDYVKARIKKRSHVLRSKRMIQAVFIGRKQIHRLHRSI